MKQEFKSLAEFYPFYLSEHRNGTCRSLHFVGTGLVLIVAAIAIVTQTPALGWALPVIGYGFAWVGHFVFEKNKPATFDYPGYSFLSDWIMFKDLLLGRIPMFGELPAQHEALQSK